MQHFELRMTLVFVSFSLGRLDCEHISIVPVSNRLFSLVCRMPAASTMTGGRALLLCTNTDNCTYQLVSG